ncbi:MAG TPA: hypothetical protein VF178_03925 [Gemmatimonadaceae bacterium]
MPWALATPLLFGTTPQLVINERHQALERGFVTASPGGQQSRDFARFQNRH